MEWMDWIRRTLRIDKWGHSSIDQYWETEGLCRIETTPQVVVRGVLGPALVSRERRYCVRG
jgi:hypothetical protein